MNKAMLKLNDFAKEIYNNAVEHGWYDEPRPFARLCCLFIDELAEAHEEARNGMPNEYYKCNGSFKCGHKNGCRCEHENGIECAFYLTKPEGIAVEMADCAIRILDYLGDGEVDIDKLFEDSKENVPDDIADLEKAYMHINTYINIAYSMHERPDLVYSEYLKINSLVDALAAIVAWFEANDLDFMDIARRKHEYNKTRPYKHGKAF